MDAVDPTAVLGSPTNDYNALLHNGKQLRPDELSTPENSMSEIDVENMCGSPIAGRVYDWDWVLVFPRREGAEMKDGHERKYCMKKFVDMMLGIGKKPSNREQVDPLRIVYRSKRCFRIVPNMHMNSSNVLSSNEKLAIQKSILEQEFHKEFNGEDYTTQVAFCEFVAKSVAKRLQVACGLTTQMFYSYDRDEIIMLIKADDRDLRIEADRTDYRIQVRNRPFAGVHKDCNERIKEQIGEHEFQEAKNHLRKRSDSDDVDEPEMDPILMRDGEKHHPDLSYTIIQWGHSESADDPSISAVKCEQGIFRRFYNAIVYISWDPLTYFAPYTSYQMENKYQPLFRWYPLNGESRTEDTLFRAVDRIRLTRSIMERHINLDALEQHRYLNAQFSLHDTNELNGLKRDWALNWKMISQPIGRIRNYFGEKIALYFSWLEFYTKMLVLPAIVGMVIEILNITRSSSTKLENEGYYLVGFSIFVVIWSAFFTEIWKRKNAIYNTLWGTAGDNITALPRPQFIGIQKRNPTTDAIEMQYESKSQYRRRLFVSFLVLVIMIFIVIIALALLFYVKNRFQDDPDLLQDISYYNALVSSINAVQIMILNIIYRYIAIKLNDWENHRTDVEYENLLVIKVFLFQFVNSFASFFYIAFIKSATQKCVAFQVVDGITVPVEVGCFQELKTQLQVLFLIRIIVGNIMEVCLPYLSYRLRLWNELRNGKGDISRDKYHIAEQQAKLNPYEEMESFEDYNEMIIQYGFITLFVVAYPVTPFLALLNNLMEVHVDSFKLCVGHRRPYPSRAKSIGSWFTFLRLMSTIAIGTNTAILLFTTDMFDSLDDKEKWLLFLAITLVCMMVKLAVETLVHDTPAHIATLNKRHNHIEATIFKGLTNDDDKELCEISESIDVQIHRNPARASDDK